MMMIDMQQMGQRAKAAARELVKRTTAQKNDALMAIAAALETHADAILAANAQDVADARAAGTDALWIKDRLDLGRRMNGMIADVRHVAKLPDPVGENFDERTLDNGLRISRRRTPLGVLGVIYESRPNVTVDVVVLAIKSGNAVILRGGKDSIRSNLALVGVLRDALVACGFPEDAVQYIESADRQYVSEMLKLHDYIDLIIPRGGASLHKLCRENSTIPVITGGIGICHLYIDETADVDAALRVIHNAKTQKPAVCNSLDTVLVKSEVAAQVLPRVVEYLIPVGVVFRAEARALAALGGVGDKAVTPANEEDYSTEWMSLVLGLKVVDSLDEAITHINAHSMGHSDGIMTRRREDAERFINEVDSSAVFWNASTRFNDGGALGLGAEIAVSTQKLHARGPMALQELTTYKWVVVGDGHVRA
jgi:glutamate-5-semialdehyde dehydrogenase